MLLTIPNIYFIIGVVGMVKRSLFVKYTHICAKPIVFFFIKQNHSPFYTYKQSSMANPEKNL